MHPSFGVPWPRLQRAAARLSELYAAPREHGRVHALLFLCGLKYLLTYRAAHGRRLSHYVDDGLREAVDHTLPVLMRRCSSWNRRRPPRVRLPQSQENRLFEQLVGGMGDLGEKLPASTARWLAAPGREANWLRLVFGMGVAARFHPDCHTFIRELLRQPLHLSRPALDVVESFHWHPDWSLALSR